MATESESRREEGEEVGRSLQRWIRLGGTSVRRERLSLSNEDHA